MSYIVWSSDLDTGIDVIDAQHRRIVDYINDLYAAHKMNDRDAVAVVLDDVIDYTLSHFGFEEAMMEDAGYPFLNAHRRVHQLFVKRVSELHERFKAGEDITGEMHNLLARWLVNHIQKEDNHYAPTIKAKLGDAASTEKKTGGWFSRFFGGKSQ